MERPGLCSQRSRMASKVRLMLFRSDTPIRLVTVGGNLAAHFEGKWVLVGISELHVALPEIEGIVPFRAHDSGKSGRSELIYRESCPCA